ncbi:MAG TPA: lipopolysaccharide biosynthesis protein, partial [Flavobacterium sp.]|nr:lipopolysaccharide biosynthesis protein [Flavobacterium sp.]
ATLVAITCYSAAKLLFVVKKMKLYPFTRATLRGLVLQVLIFAAFYFWDFPFGAWVSIVLKSMLLTAVYAVAVYQMKLSPDVNRALDAFLGTARFKR